MANSQRQVAIVVLGAGSSQRMGMKKQLLEIEGEPMLRRAVKIALSTHASRVYATIPVQDEEVGKALDGLGVEIVQVSRPELGQSESIRAGLTQVERSDCDAILFMPCDLPLLEANHLNALIERYRGSKSPVVASRYDGVVGTPLLLDKSLWQELKELRGDVGARKIVAAYPDSISAIDWEGGKFDLDTPEDKRRFMEGTENK